MLSLAESIPSDALLHAPSINKIPISAVASVKTSGVFVTAIPLALAASKSIFPKPTAKFEIIFIVSGNLFIVSASSLSVKEDNIPSFPSLISINFFCEYNSSFKFKLASKLFNALSSQDLSSFLVTRIFFILNFIQNFWFRTTCIPI